LNNLQLEVADLLPRERKRAISAGARETAQSCIDSPLLGGAGGKKQSGDKLSDAGALVGRPDSDHLKGFLQGAGLPLVSRMTVSERTEQSLHLRFAVVETNLDTLSHSWSNTKTAPWKAGPQESKTEDWRKSIFTTTKNSLDLGRLVVVWCPCLGGNMLRLRRGVQRNLPGSPQVMSVGAPFRRPTLDVLDDGGRLAVAPRKRHHRDGSSL